MRYLLLFFGCLFQCAYATVSLKVDNANVSKVPLDIMMTGETQGCAPAIQKLEYATSVLGLFEPQPGAHMAKIQISISGRTWKLVFEHLGTPLLDVQEDCSAQSAILFVEQVYKKVTGVSDFFHTKLAFVGEMGMGRNLEKGLYWMNLDGSELERLVPDKDFVLFPKFSASGNYLSFVSFEKYGSRGVRQELFVMDLRTRRVSSVYAKWGDSLGSAVFHPKDDNILIASVRRGRSRGLYVIDRRQPHTAKPLNYPFGFEVEPTLSPSGSMLVFSSLRTGRPMLFTLPMVSPDQVTGKTVRLTYVGRYNSAPTVSSDSQWIVFSAYHNDDFDLFKIDSTGRLIFKLTDTRSNEEAPAFSVGDPKHVVFVNSPVNNSAGSTLRIMHIDFPGHDFQVHVPLHAKIKLPDWSGVLPYTRFHF